MNSFPYILTQRLMLEKLRLGVNVDVSNVNTMSETLTALRIASNQGVNAGKVYFTQNPMAINYPQWIAFAKYSYQQLKGVLIEKPSARDGYVRGIINEQLAEIFEDVDSTCDEISADYIVVFE